MRVSICGTRDLSHGDFAVIEDHMMDVLSEAPEEILFGGARGTDTMALAAVCAALGGHRPPKLTVIVPRRLSDQPVEAQEWARECADEVVELKAQKLTRDAYFKRNRKLVERADFLLTFWDGKSTGTAMTIEFARDVGLPFEIVHVRGGSFSLGASSPSYKPLASFQAPWPHWLYGPTPMVGMPLVTLGFYMAAVEGLDRLSQFVRATKAGTVSPVETRYWADITATLISARPELKDASMVIPVPRRFPGRPNDMAALSARIAAETGKEDGTGLLVRVAEPLGGEVKAGRERFPSEEHSRTMAVDPGHKYAESLKPGAKVILLDNVVTFGGTLEGARQTFIRDVPDVSVIGLPLLVSEGYSIT